MGRCWPDRNDLIGSAREAIERMRYENPYALPATGALIAALRLISDSIQLSVQC